MIQNGRDLAARYRIDHGRVRFALAGYDPAAPVVIDPVVSYATYLGGAGLDSAGAIAVDADGNAYVTGVTDSTDFPMTTGSPLAGGTDVFVTKLAPDGATAVYSTYIGGSANDAGVGIAVDAGGQAFITGNTASTNFPATTGAYQTTMRGAADTSSPSSARRATRSSMRPTSEATTTTITRTRSPSTRRQRLRHRAHALGDVAHDGRRLLDDEVRQRVRVRLEDRRRGWLARILTFLGGLDGSQGWGIAVDTSGSAYVIGRLAVTVNAAGRFPTTTGAFQETAPVGTHGFISKLTPAGDSLVYSSYLHSTGANHNDDLHGVAVDSAGNAYVAGSTDAATWPTTAGAFQTASAGSNETFVLKLNPTGSALVYSTYLGGASADIAHGLAMTQPATHSSPATRRRPTFQRRPTCRSRRSGAACTMRSLRGSTRPARCSCTAPISAVLRSTRPTASR